MNQFAVLRRMLRWMELTSCVAYTMPIRYFAPSFAARTQMSFRSISTAAGRMLWASST